MALKIQMDLNRSLQIAARVSVVALGLTVPLLDQAIADYATLAGTATRIALWALWAVAFLCILVPSCTALTCLRLAAPSNLAVVLFTILATDSWSPRSLVSVMLSLICVSTVFSAEVGNAFAQLSAYGDERRFLLRCPTDMVIVQCLMWTLWVATAITAISFFNDENWIAGTVFAVLTAGLSYILPSRFHRFSRRWLVGVPAGVVIHDSFALAETAMFMKQSIAHIGIETNSENSEAADLSGGCRGPSITISLREFDKVILAATRKNPGGKALHVQTMRVCPTRVARTVQELTS